MSGKKDIRQLIRSAKRRGWEIELTGGDHYKWRHPNGFFYSSQTPSDDRVVLKIKKQVAAMEAGKPNMGR